MLQPIHILRLSVAVLAVAVGVLWVKSLDPDPARHLATSRWPNLGIPMKDDVPDLSGVQIEFSRSPCLGSCPAYRLTVHGDGTGTFEGLAYVARTGVVPLRLAPGFIMELLDRLDAADFMDLEHECWYRLTDLSYPDLTLRIGDRSHTVGDRDGLGGMQLPGYEDSPHAVALHATLRSLFDSVDRICGVDAFIGPPQVWDSRPLPFEDR